MSCCRVSPTESRADPFQVSAGSRGRGHRSGAGLLPDGAEHRALPGSPCLCAATGSGRDSQRGRAARQALRRRYTCASRDRWDAHTNPRCRAGCGLSIAPCFLSRLIPALGVAEIGLPEGDPLVHPEHHDVLFVPHRLRADAAIKNRVHRLLEGNLKRVGYLNRRPPLPPTAPALHILARVDLPAGGASPLTGR